MFRKLLFVTLIIQSVLYAQFPIVTQNHWRVGGSDSLFSNYNKVKFGNNMFIGSSGIRYYNSQLQFSNNLVDWYNIPTSLTQGGGWTLGFDKIYQSTTNTPVHIRLTASDTTASGLLNVYGSVNIKRGSIYLDTTRFSTQYGVIYKNGVRFIHDFNYGWNGTVTTAGYNTFIGINAGNFTMGSTATQTYEASYNNGFGAGALEKIQTVWGTDAFGYTALYNLEIGYGTVAVGYYAGRFISGDIPLTSAYYGIYIGANTKPLANGNINEIVIGYNATGAGSNSVVLGNTSITKTILRGNVAFGVSDNNPTAKVDIQGSTGYNQLRLRTSYTPTGTSDPNGNVGDITWDNNYIYVKTSSGWKRAALSTW